MPANGRGFALKVQTTDSATENIPPGGFVRRVRVKRCGKSAPRPEQSGWQGKPHVEQDQIGEEERPAPLLLPGRLLEPVSNGRSRRMVAARFGGYRNRLTDRAGYSLSWFDWLWGTDREFIHAGLLQFIARGIGRETAMRGQSRHA